MRSHEYLHHGDILSRSCSVNLSQLREEDVHDLLLNVTSAPTGGGGDYDGSEISSGRGEWYRGTIHCLLQICSTNVEEETEGKPVNMNTITRRYVSVCGGGTAWWGKLIICDLLLHVPKKQNCYKLATTDLDVFK